jgi:hypothetical protein
MIGTEGQFLSHLVDIGYEKVNSIGSKIALKIIAKISGRSGK